MERNDKEKPIKIGTLFRRGDVIYKIEAFVNCAPKSETCFWDYILSYKNKKKQDYEIHVDSNVLACYYEKV